MEPSQVDWLDSEEQKKWFNDFISEDVNGLKFAQFQKFLNSTIYKHLKSILATADQTNEKNVNENKFTYQQELQLFEVFNSRSNNHILNFDEFSQMCQNWLHKVFHRSSALVVVDVQNDFIDGSLALINGPAEQDGADVVPVINKLLDRCNFQAVVYTQDWHPIDHIGFHENLHLRKYQKKSINGHNPDNDNNNNTQDIKEEGDQNSATGDEQKISRLRVKKLNHDVKLFDSVVFDEGRMEQKLWPVHCVQESWGAELHPKLKVIHDAIRIYKGTLSNVDAYSAFWDNLKLNETGLRRELLNRKIDDVFFCGLALDYCVAASALDSAKAGFTTFVIEDACKGISNEEMDRAKREMIDSGIIIVNSDLVDIYCSNPKLLLKISFKNALALVGNPEKSSVDSGD